MPPLLPLAAAAAFTAWLFIILPRLTGHLEPWEREYDAAHQAFARNDFATAEQHLLTAYDLAGKHDSTEGQAIAAAGLADVLAKLGRHAEAEQYRSRQRPPS
jgi:hypothetical protein